MDKEKSRDLSMYTLLVVEDDQSLRDLLAVDLSSRGFHVLTASGGNQAIEVLSKNQIHLVLSDIQMPDGDGFGLLQHLKDSSPSRPPLIFISGFADVNEQECLRRGALQVFPKPFSRKELFQAILGALSMN